MGVKYKEIYACEGCGTEFESSDSVRTFKGIVQSGDGTKIFIQSEMMYCLECLPLALDYQNVVPETVQIVKKESMEDQILKEEARAAIENMRRSGEQLFKESLKPIENQKLIQDQIFLNTDGTLSQEKIESVDKFEQELWVEEPQDINTLKHGDELTQEYVEHITSPQEEPQTTSQEPETTNEIINSETEEDVFEEQIGHEYGECLILRLISSEIDEKRFAKKNGYKDIKDLQAACGMKSLVGLYYSTNRYCTEQIRGLYQPTVKVINKIFFGVPNIVERNVWEFKNDKIALIKKELFDDKIEPLKKYEVPQEIGQEIVIPEKILNVNETMLGNLVDSAVEVLKEDKVNEYEAEATHFEELKKQAQLTGVPIITATQKKNIKIGFPQTVLEQPQKKHFSKSTIGDDYI